MWYQIKLKMKQISQNIGTHKRRQRRIERTSIDTSNPLHRRHPSCIRTDYICNHGRNYMHRPIYKVYRSYSKTLLSRTIIVISD
jgi:hypothetical protein